MKWRWLLVALAVPALLAAAAAGIAAWWLQRPLPLAQPVVEVSIERGTSPRAVAQAWVDAGVRTSPELLYQWFRWSGDAPRIRAGSYEVHTGVTPRELLGKMVRGDEVLEAVRLIEGWTFRQFRAALAAAPNLRPTIAGLSDADVMAAIGAPGKPAEGWFFPDTYLYSRGVSDLTVLKRAHAAMQRHLDAAWAARADGLPLKSPDEALILASIVEKETGVEADRRLVAGVFVNRLRIGMRLQTDPAVIYGLGEAFDGNLTRRHLETDGPYNTYTRAGLPPTPIAMPGLASLRAAVNPEPTKALYFVARGDGSSVFSETLEDHNRAVNRYQRGQR
ncbi:endolytic transglycosylase MltG [Calidifontimicrobium sp. SYSU G02091]|uniref:endolytic transglycosylase MltG n=1 Tax=Calidifontimicrobium sp. SYSU G02091 TaxID=2926421 RepID=UPI001F53A3C4|nr:endolytic transglycosylase MltG [Calidifontimicrobium sp. SYSU G02091]MCI1192079.1 endolytic transglycosylase MltG [Calidifontimicrobium sp. SYSU G02091]